MFAGAREEYKLFFFVPISSLSSLLSYLILPLESFLLSVFSHFHLSPIRCCRVLSLLKLFLFLFFSFSFYFLHFSTVLNLPFVPCSSLFITALPPVSDPLPSHSVPLSSLCSFPLLTCHFHNRLLLFPSSLLPPLSFRFYFIFYSFIPFPLYTSIIVSNLT